MQAAGGEPVYLGLAEDKFETVHAAVKDGLARCDLVLLSGGSSVGDQDVSDKVLAKLGPPGVLARWLCVQASRCLQPFARVSLCLACQDIRRRHW